MGVASLVLGILGLIICWIPCVGAYALVPSILGLILGAVGIANAKKTNQGKGLAIAGLVCSIVATVVAAYWAYLLNEAGSLIDEAAKEFEKELKTLESSTL